MSRAQCPYNDIMVFRNIFKPLHITFAQMSLINAQADVGLICGLSFHLHPYFGSLSSMGSGESADMPRIN